GVPSRLLIQSEVSGGVVPPERSAPRSSLSPSHTSERINASHLRRSRLPRTATTTLPTRQPTPNIPRIHVTKYRCFLRALGCIRLRQSQLRRSPSAIRQLQLHAQIHPFGEYGAAVLWESHDCPWLSLTRHRDAHQFPREASSQRLPA